MSWATSLHSNQGRTKPSECWMQIAWMTSLFGGRTPDRTHNANITQQNGEQQEQTSHIKSRSEMCPTFWHTQRIYFPCILSRASCELQKEWTRERERESERERERKREAIKEGAQAKKETGLRKEKERVREIRRRLRAAAGRKGCWIYPARARFSCSWIVKGLGRIERIVRQVASRVLQNHKSSNQLKFFYEKSKLLTETEAVIPLFF